MKKILLSLLAASTLIGLDAQTVVSSTTSGTVATGPALTPSSLAYTFPGITNLFGAVLTNLNNGASLNDIAPLLSQLETNLVLLLPPLAKFNSTIDTVANVNVGTAQVGVNPGNNLSTLTTANLSTLNSANLGSSYATALGSDVSGIVGGRATALAPAAPALTTTTGPNGVTTTTAAIMTGNPAGGIAASGQSASNHFAFTNSQDALRALALLQTDIEAMLPIVQALNGTGATNAATIPLVVPAPTTALAPALTPTGR